jgi:hypothetical protein
MVGGVFQWMIDGLTDYEVATEAIRSIQDWEPSVVASDRWVSSGQRALFMVNRVEAYRYAGGYLEALRWTEPVVVSLAVDGARLVGAEAYAALLEEAVAVVFPRGLPHSEREEDEAWAWFEQGEGTRNRSLEALDSRLDPGDLYECVARFVREHPNEFFDKPLTAIDDTRARLDFVDELLELQDSNGLARIRNLLTAALAQSAEAGDETLSAICRERLAQIDNLAILRPTKEGP